MAILLFLNSGTNNKLSQVPKETRISSGHMLDKKAQSINVQVRLIYTKLYGTKFNLFNIVGNELERKQSLVLP